MWILDFVIDMSVIYQIWFLLFDDYLDGNYIDTEELSLLKDWILDLDLSVSVLEKCWFGVKKYM